MSRYVFICVVQCVWSCWARACSCMMIRRTEMLSWLVSRCKIMMASHGYRRKAPHATISWEFSLDFKILCVYVWWRGGELLFWKTVSGLTSSARHICSCVFALTGSSILSQHVTCWPKLHWTVFIFAAALSLHLSWMCTTSSFATGRPQIIKTWLTLAFPCCVCRAFKVPTWILGPTTHIYRRNVCYFITPPGTMRLSNWNLRTFTQIEILVSWCYLKDSSPTPVAFAKAQLSYFPSFQVCVCVCPLIWKELIICG